MSLAHRWTNRILYSVRPDLSGNGHYVKCCAPAAVTLGERGPAGPRVSIEENAIRHYGEGRTHLAPTHPFPVAARRAAGR